MPDFLRLIVAAVLGAALALAVSALWRNQPEQEMSSSAALRDLQTEFDQLSEAQQSLKLELFALRRSGDASAANPDVPAGQEVAAADAGELTALSASSSGPAPSVDARGNLIATPALLVGAGIDPTDAEQLAEQLDALALARLEADFNLRNASADDATHLRKERSAIPRDQEVIRNEFGDGVYDRYLYATGRPNRVAVSSVLRESAAVSIGVEPGDFLRSLDGKPLFSVRDLTQQVRAGSPDRSYALSIERDGQVFETWVPGGPLGVRVSGAKSEPDT